MPETEFVARQRSGNCDNDACAVIVIVEVHPETPMPGLPEVAEWEGSWTSSCPVCHDGNIDWDFAEDHASWERRSNDSAVVEAVRADLQRDEAAVKAEALREALDHLDELEGPHASDGLIIRLHTAEQVGTWLSLRASTAVGAALVADPRAKAWDEGYHDAVATLVGKGGPGNPYRWTPPTAPSQEAEA